MSLCFCRILGFQSVLDCCAFIKYGSRSHFYINLLISVEVQQGLLPKVAVWCCIAYLLVTSLFFSDRSKEPFFFFFLKAYHKSFGQLKLIHANSVCKDYEVERLL